MRVSKKFWVIFSISGLFISSAIVIPTTILTTQKYLNNNIDSGSSNQPDQSLPEKPNNPGSDSSNQPDQSLPEKPNNPGSDSSNQPSNPGSDSSNQPNNPGSDSSNGDNTNPSLPPSIPETDITLSKQEAELLQKQSYQYGFEPNESDTDIIYNNKELTNKDIIELIRKRTFSISFVNNTGSNNILPGLNGGTAWLLDYSPLNDSIGEGFKLFLATNFHVARLLVNNNDYDEYKQTNIINNGGYTQRMVLSWKSSFNGQTQSFSYKNMGLPKTLFMAQNFIDDKNANKYMEDFIIENKLNKNEYNSYYSDFAVLELDYHFVESDKNSDDARDYTRVTNFKHKIEQAIEVVDGSIKQFKNNLETKNNNGLLPYSALSYIDTDGYNNIIRKSFSDQTLIKDVETIKQEQKESDTYYYQKLFHNFKNYSLIPKNAYTYGYPWTNNVGSFTEATTIPIDSIDKDKPTNQALTSIPRSYNTYELIHMNYKFVNDSNTGSATVYWNNKKMFANYGNACAILIPYNGNTTGGMSGSLVVNEQALPIGLVFAQFSKNRIFDCQYDYVWTMYFIPFVNNIPIVDNQYYDNNLPVQSYNLIDGTNKNLYPLQTNSYKHSLLKYHPNLETALFKK